MAYLSSYWHQQIANDLVLIDLRLDNYYKLMQTYEQLEDIAYATCRKLAGLEKLFAKWSCGLLLDFAQ